MFTGELTLLPSGAISQSDAERGEAAARLIWQDAEGVEDIVDPRTTEFATAVVAGLASALAGAPGAIKKMMHSAASAAEDLNVGQFQGLIEVIQNADDLGASEVRFAFRDGMQGRQLLIVHNGQPVICQHVLGMALPFLTTKTHRTDQRGRFGIGLKTLKRIASRLAIHSAPYHFSGDQSSLGAVAAEAELPSFYHPAIDTLIVLDLMEGLHEAELKVWFDAWDDDGLIFLSSVSSFRWCDLAGNTIDGRKVDFRAWRSLPIVLPDGALTNLSLRKVRGESDSWIVWKASLSVPGHLHPAHKARSDTTHISVAVPRKGDSGSLYIGFKTRVTVELSFSIDAQFDPSTAREALIENAWNNWLIERCGDVLAEIASGLLAQAPEQAWRFVPLSDEYIGNETDPWLRGSFAASFAAARERIGMEAVIALQEGPVPLGGIAYESQELVGLLTDADIESLVEDVRALPGNVRDVSGRWRAVLDEVGVSTRVGTDELLNGFSRQLFIGKAPAWWVRAARVLVECHNDEELFGAPFWLSDDGRALLCLRAGATAKPLVLGGEVSPFGLRWNLLDRLHTAYGLGDEGGVAVAWLDEKAAFRTSVDAELEFAAFAERFGDEKLEIEDADLRQLRNHFDHLSDHEAEELGRKVGAVLLLDGHVFKGGKLHRQKVSPGDAYLCKTLDSDSPHWPTAAGTLPGIQWVAARYHDQLKTGATRQSRKRADGTISRGPRKFLMLLGAETAPRLNETGPVRWGGTTRVRELRAVDAQQVPRDYVSLDLERVLAAFPKLSKKALRVRSPALLKAMARAWGRLYADRKTVASQHERRVYLRPPVTADWLVKLRETQWVAVGKGDLVTPGLAVIKTLETQTLYANSAFAVDVDPGELGGDLRQR